MTRAEAISRLVDGLIRMENGQPNLFIIPTLALETWQNCRSYKCAEDKDNYAKFVCAVILGKFDDQLKDWV
jgi:hypothetical protein